MKFIYTTILFFLTSLAGFSQSRYFYATLSGAQEVPANPSTASGVVIIKYNTSTRFLQLWGDYEGLSAAASASHIHSPAAPGSNAVVLYGINNTGGTTGTLTFNVTLTAPQETDLYAGNMYVNVHNPVYPGGEIRGQLLESTNGQTVFFSGRLQGAQESTPNASTATGYVRSILDKSLNMVYTTGSFTGLAANASAAHIHSGAATVAGPVFTNLTVTTATSGVLHTAATIAPADATAMLNSNSYVNVHNATFPGGEIRGQLLQEYNQRYLQATLQGSQEVPPSGSAATGIVIARYNTETKLLELEGVFTNLGSNIGAAHIHSPAAVGVNAGVTFGIAYTGTTSGTLTLSTTLTAPQEADMFDGLMYVNVHSTVLTSGEIRGQLLSTAPGNTFYLKSNLQGTQEVPASGSSATGNAQVLLDNMSKEVFLSGNFSGLAAAATAAHIHQAPAGTNGGVVVNLTPTNATSGTFNGTATVSPAFADQVISGNSYANVHNPVFPGGEIRGQFGNLVLPVKLLFFNGFKKENKVQLQWATADEINLSRFEVEQLDSRTSTWNAKSVMAARALAGNNQYQQEDAPAGDNQPFLFYRLKIIDSDGRFTYSPVIKISNGKSGLSINLDQSVISSSALGFSLTGSPTTTALSANIIDNTGRLVMKTQVSTRQKNLLNVGRLAPGVYQIIIRVNEENVKQSFIKL